MAQTINSRTQSGNGSRPRNRSAWFSLVFGLLAVAAIPVGVLITNYRNDLRLLHAGFAVPLAAVFGFVAVRLARRARRRLERTIGRSGGAVPARLGRILGWLGLYVALIGAIALGFYYVEYHVLS
jgi:hypothetical protein